MIAAFGLLASTGSTAAAWEAWRTARAVEHLGRESLAIGGLEITVTPELSGNVGTDCDSPHTGSDSFQGYVEIRNHGRAGGDIGVIVHADGYLPGDGGSGQSYDFGMSVTIPPTSNTTYAVDVPCAAIKMTDRKMWLILRIGAEAPMKVPLKPENINFSCADPTHSGYDVKC